MDVIYDLETFYNCFTFCGVNADRSKGVLFEISPRKNDLHKMLSYFRELMKNKDRMVGFNNLGFDYPVLHWILLKAKDAKEQERLSQLSISAKEIYFYAQELIEKSYTDRFGSIIPTRERFIEQVDLFKIHHFDNRARATSLKMIEFNMRSNTIEDLPYYHGNNLTSEQIDKLISYNKHDVMRTLDFYDASKEKIEFRKSISEKFGFDATNFSDAKIGSEYFVKKLEEANPGCCYKQVGKHRKLNQTKRDKIEVKDILLDYLQFTNPAFQAIHDWFKNQTIIETKGTFTDLPEWKLGEVAKYADMKVKKKKIDPKHRELKLKEMSLSWIEEVELKSTKGKVSYYHCYNEASALNVKIDDLIIVFGVGGIHAAIEKVVWKADEKISIQSKDVSSMYPNLSIANRLAPAHLGETFCDIYEEMYKERKKYPKGSSENLALKLGLNATYGNSNNEYSPIYDPQYTMSITINGQLSLLMLADMLMTKVEGLKVVMLNTDGLEYLVDRDKVELADGICKEWESITKLELEGVEYDRLIVRDINNYLGVYAE